MSLVKSFFKIILQDLYPLYHNIQYADDDTYQPAKAYHSVELMLHHRHNKLLHLLYAHGVHSLLNNSGDIHRFQNIVQRAFGGTPDELCGGSCYPLL